MRRKRRAGFPRWKLYKIHRWLKACRADGVLNADVIWWEYWTAYTQTRRLRVHRSLASRLEHTWLNGNLSAQDYVALSALSAHRASQKLTRHERWKANLPSNISSYE